MSQTTIAEAMGAALPGQLADLSPHTVESFVSEDALDMPMGAVAVAQGTADNGAILPAASNAKLVGILMHSHQYSKDPNGDLGIVTPFGLHKYAVLNVLRKGRIYVIAEEDVSPGDPLFVRYAAGAGGSQLGAFRRATVSSEMIDLTKVGVFRSTTSAGGLAILEVDFTNKP